MAGAASDSDGAYGQSNAWLIEGFIIASGVFLTLFGCMVIYGFSSIVVEASLCLLVLALGNIMLLLRYKKYRKQSQL